MLGGYKGKQEKNWGVAKQFFNASNRTCHQKLAMITQLKIAKLAHKNNTSLKLEALKTKLISEKEYDKLVNP